MKTKLLMSLLFAVCVAQSQTRQVVRVRLNDNAAVSKAIQFFCTENYDRQGCLNDSLALRQSLVPYPTPELGAWSFVLVPADDWRTLLRRVGGPPGSPAFSILDLRVTVLDQSLFGGSEARNAELLHSFGVIGPSLLDLVVTHELGHGLCLEIDERRADDYGRGLRNRKPMHCSKAPEHAAADTSRRYREWLDSVSRSRASRANWRKHLAFSQPKRSEEAFEADAGGYVGNEACAKCHGSIYRSYMKTAMAQASGPAAENFVAGSFTHEPSGINYEIYRSNEKAWLSFDRPGDPVVRGKRELLYYIGQGRRGRTYLFSVDGFVFEAPVNWYADRQMWDMPPAYSDTREIPMNLPALMSCLECHGSGIQPPVAGTENRYNLPILSYAGVICERCHGPGKAHTTGGPIVNPGKLNAKLRDQVCMQCHLEGNVAIERTGRHLYEYKPGDDLFQYVRYFVLSTREPGRLRAASQFEALEQSTCKKKSGYTISCTSCHDPHQTVRPEERVNFYRGKCLACHSADFAAKHHRDQPDCTGCHMPASLSSDIAHTEVTDHRILRRPQDALHPPRPIEAFPQLVVFPPSEKAEQNIRDLALAWQATVNSGMTAAQHRAEQSLRAALKGSPADPAVLSSLAYVEQRRGADHEARRLYGEALKSDPDSIDAATNLGVLEAKEGHLDEAVKLWQPAFGRAPGRSEIGMNLGRSLCAVGRYDQARDIVMRVLQFNPDLGMAKRLLRHLNKIPPDCGL